MGWNEDDDANRLEALKQTACRIRQQNRPIIDEVRAAEKKVSNVNHVNLDAALKGKTTSAKLPDNVRDILMEQS